jgi:hypothetical protein
MGYPRIPRAPLVLVALAPLAFAGGCSTTTYGTGESPEMALFSELTGNIGILPGQKKKQPIEYQPRAPLVMPSNVAQLPEPTETASVTNPDWPVQPGEQQVASAAQADDDPRNDISQAEYRRLRPVSGAFAAAGANQRGAGSNDELNNDRTEYYRDIVHGNEKRKKFRASVADMNGLSRNERRYLTDPPLTYREPAATAPEAYQQAKTKKKKRFFGLFGGGGDDSAAEPATATEQVTPATEAQL